MTGSSLSWGAKLAYGVGGIANGVKMRAVTAYLMLFYSQVIGLSAAVVSAVIMISLIFDAVFDPLIGHVSDNFRSRWGRRHPFMYASALPYPLFFILLWNPPDWPAEALAAYLLAVLIGVRLFDTFFELPTAALAPELARGYDERTGLATIRALCGIIGTAGFSILTLNVILKENADGGGGVLARDGYLSYGLAGGLLIFVVIMICTLGTHSQIPKLSKAPPKGSRSGARAKDALFVIRNRSFLAVAIGGLLAAAATGMSQGLDIYWSLYIYRLSQPQIANVTVAVLAFSVVGAALAPRLAKRIGKRNAALCLFSLWITLNLAPLALVLAGALPSRGAIYAVVLPCLAISAAASASALVMMTSMLMDVVEQVQLQTGRRLEGLLFASESLVKKVTSGLGVLISGLILAAVSFPRGAERHEVPAETLHQMAYLYMPIKLGIFLACMVAISFYALTREAHEKNLAVLAAKEGA